ncbi:hypothetical protein [Isoalcanivorax indicus]|uniref:hypothetical protein n=1 Tax=Isoalcanivorax indicus TaxID=2202653 RepID=UPI0013C4692D|nr:hypothetical protein [Isoalcanivorax indicus]
MQSTKKRIMVRHYTLDTPAGNNASEVCAAINEGNPGFRIYDTLPVSARTGQGSAFPLLGLIGSPDGQALLSPDRLLFRLNTLLDAPDDCPRPQIALLCHPATTNPQYPALAKALLPRLKARLQDYGIEHIEHVDEQQFPAALSRHLQELEQGKQPALLIVSLDSLVNHAALHARLADHDARTTDNPHGRVLSEALCALWLEAVGEETELADGTVMLERLVTHHEPDDQLPDRRWHRALPEAAAKALGCEAPGDLANPVPRPHHIMLARAQTMADEMIWYQTQSALWPLRLSPRDNLAMRKGEKAAPQPEPLPAQHIMRPAMTLGDTGASTLTLAIILAAEWMRAPEQPAQECLLLDHIRRQRLALLIRQLVPHTAEAAPEVAHA